MILECWFYMFRGIYRHLINAQEQIYSRFVQNVKLVKPTFSTRRGDTRTTAWACATCLLFENLLPVASYSRRVSDLKVPNIRIASRERRGCESLAGSGSMLPRKFWNFNALKRFSCVLRVRFRSKMLAKLIVFFPLFLFASFHIQVLDFVLYCRLYIYVFWVSVSIEYTLLGAPVYLSKQI